MILILGGTSEARRLAEALDRAGARFVLSLAGRTTTPLVVGEARMAGFGGVDGLHAYLRANDVAVVVDATHPFAAGMSRNAAEACALAGVRLVRLDRPGWAGHPLAASWAWVADHDEAARAAVAHGASRILLTVGRQHTLDYSPALDDRYVLARVTEAPDRELPARWELLQARGPFELADERELFARHAIDCLVTKDSGGASTSAKLTAAHESGAQVIVIRRPAPPSTATVVGSVEEALAALA